MVYFVQGTVAQVGGVWFIPIWVISENILGYIFDYVYFCSCRLLYSKIIVGEYVTLYHVKWRLLFIVIISISY